MRLIVPGNQSSAAFQEHKVIRLVRVSQWIASRCKLLSIQNQISSQAEAFQAFSVFTTRKTSAEVIAMSSSKCTSSASNAVIMTGFIRNLKYSFHLSKILHLIAGYDQIFFDGSSREIGCATKTRDSFPKNVVGLPVFGIQFMSEVNPRLHFEHFARVFRASAYRRIIIDLCKEH